MTGARMVIHAIRYMKHIPNQYRIIQKHKPTNIYNTYMQIYVYMRHQDIPLTRNE